MKFIINITVAGNQVYMLAESDDYEGVRKEAEDQILKLKADLEKKGLSMAVSWNYLVLSEKWK